MRTGIAIIDTEEEQQKSRTEPAGASVQFGGDSMSVTSPTEEAAPATGHQEQRSTEHPSDQWQVSTYPCVALQTHCN